MLASPHATVHILGLSPIDTRLDLCIERLLKACRTPSSSAVAVAGPSAGSAMSVLWRRGFERVEAARRVTCPCADQLSDLLLILGCGDAAKAGEVISAVLPILREGGVLAVDASLMAGSEERLKLCRALAHRGLRYREGAHQETEILAYKPEAHALALAS
jgi:hypothetical protein